MNITLQNIIEKKYPAIIKRRKDAKEHMRLQKELEQQKLERLAREEEFQRQQNMAREVRQSRLDNLLRDVQLSRLDNVPILIDRTHILPGINAILTLSGRQSLDLVHHVTRGSRRFVMMRDYTEMKGFVLEMKRTIPTLVRGEVLIEVEGIERYVVDRVFIPEDRQGFYLDESQALRFATGRVIKDIEKNNFNSQEEQREYENQLTQKLRELESLFDRQINSRADQPR